MVGLNMSWKMATWLCRVGKSFLTTDYHFSGRIFNSHIPVRDL